MMMALKSRSTSYQIRGEGELMTFEEAKARLRELQYQEGRETLMEDTTHSRTGVVGGIEWQAREIAKSVAKIYSTEGQSLDHFKLMHRSAYMRIASRYVTIEDELGYAYEKVDVEELYNAHKPSGRESQFYVTVSWLMTKQLEITATDRTQALEKAKKWIEEQEDTPEGGVFGEGSICIDEVYDVEKEMSHLGGN